MDEQSQLWARPNSGDGRYVEIGPFSVDDARPVSRPAYCPAPMEFP
jgi:hypothetical protein